MAKTYRREAYSVRDANAEREHHEWRARKRLQEEELTTEELQDLMRAELQEWLEDGMWDE